MGVPFDIGASAQGAGAGAAAGSIFGPVGTAVGAGIGFFAPIVAGLIGQALSAGDTQRARDLADAAVARFGPDVLKAPEVAQLMPHLGPSAMQGVNADPQSIAAQHEALSELGRYGTDPNNIEFRGAMDAAEQGANQESGAQQGAIEQAMQARGMGGSGAAFAARAVAGQGAANRAASTGFQAAAEGRRQALSALGQYGSLAGQVRGQSFHEGEAKANAADEINRFNELGRTGAYQQDFNNRMGLATAGSNAQFQGANVAAGHAAQTQQNFANIGAGAGQAGNAFAVESNNQDAAAEAERRRLAAAGGG